MKRIHTILFKSAILLLILAGTPVLLSSFGSDTISEAQAAVKASEVQAYLEARGYQVSNLQPVYNSENWTADTMKGGVRYRTTVFVRGTSIIDHEDTSI